MSALESARIAKAGVEKGLAGCLPRIAQRLASFAFGEAIVLCRDELHVMICQSASSPPSVAARPNICE